ncbi:MAG: hypothetical protein K0Q77_47 [Anaerosporomusa subterranea]|jgi:hypothetical protein|nr:hypothetical protein [Anaerosporomusa subterranea]MDF2572310.1 hypothetical protein [Sporomusa sp.]
MRRGNTSRYDNNNATLEEEIERRKYMLSALRADENPDGSKPYALAYGFVDNQGRKKLLRRCPVFPTFTSFDRYIRRHKQTVLAVYNLNAE